MKILLVPFIVLLGYALHAQNQSAPTQSNTELKILVDEDQRIRSDRQLTAAERASITLTDADRRACVKAMLAANQLRTAVDYRNAAIIMQHGATSDDYLLAHTLAVVAASKNDATALWLSAATLDRYLLSIKQPQIYGTQYNHFDQSKPWTQEPYARGLIGDDTRKVLGVPSLTEQKRQLDGFSKPSPAK